MNRAERRRAKRTAEKPKTYVLTDDQIQQIKFEAMEYAFRMLLAVPSLVLHDKFGFGRIRLDRFNYYALSWLKSVQKGEVSLETVMTLCKEEAGYDVIKED